MSAVFQKRKRGVDDSYFFEVKKINDLDVKPYACLEKKTKSSSILGEEVLGNYLTHRIAIAGQSECGKTVLLVRLLEKIVHPVLTRVYWFSTTAKKDPTVQQFIKKMYFKKDPETGEYVEKFPVLVEIYESVYQTDEETGKVINLLEVIRHMFDEKPLIEKHVQIPKCVVVFDDFTSGLKHISYLDEFTKIMRHLKSILIMVFHDLIDIPKTIRQEVTLALLFGGASKERFLMFLDHMGFISSCFSHEQLYDFYVKNITVPLHNFLYLNKRTKQIRLNLNKEITC